MFWDGNMGLWGYILMGVGFVLFWAAVIAAIILFARSIGGGNRTYEGGVPMLLVKLPEEFFPGRGFRF